jgi:hypothetical protein
LRKGAVIIMSPLLTMQINRVSPNSIFRNFTDEQEALDWLAD